MGALKQPGQYFIIEPFYWLFQCFFQPARFQKDFAQIPLVRRNAIMVRLFIPMFLSTYPLALLIRISLFGISHDFYKHYLISGTGGVALNVAPFLLDATWAVILSCSMGSLFGSFFGTEYGIVFGLADGIVNGIVIYLANHTVIMLFCGGVSGLLLGLTFNSTGVLKRGGLKATSIGIVYGLAIGSIVGLLVGFFCGFEAGRASLFLGEHFGHLRAPNGGGLAGNIVGILAGVTAGCFVMKIVGTIARGNSRVHRDLVDVATHVGIAVAGALGATIGLLTGNYGLQGDKNIATVLALDGLPGLLAWILFLACYIPGYYRIPLYPISAFSMIRAYFSSRMRPAYIFLYLHRSSLYWDECVFPPLPRLQQILSIAAEQNRDETLSELHFIFQERSQQRKAAQAISLEITLNDLNWRENLRDICSAQQQLAVTITPEIRRVYPAIAHVIQRIEDASQDATNYYVQMTWPGRAHALNSMLANLQNASSHLVFNDAFLNVRFEKIVRKWQSVAHQELRAIELKQASEETGRIENPYVPGLILEQRDPLFVGRADLTRQLSMALHSEHPPTFFLTGERRMGKSSILKQLPILLGSHYLPIFYDLQSTGITSSVAALLAAVAEEVYDTLLTRGILVRKLEYERLRDDLRENEAVAYHRFTRWLQDVQRVLAQEERFLLLLFDEFEKLSEAEAKGYLDLNLLFGWFRSIIQQRSHLVLLFSGVKSIAEMDTRWTGYFVNVELLRVSFLEPEEARRLIKRPVPDFPGEHIFSDEITDEILRVTGGHPFLIQALCSALITRLNSNSRQQANREDVVVAIEEVFKKWGDSYFGDLWERTDPIQRQCLKIICKASGICTFDYIQQCCQMDEASLFSHLEKLLKRDLLRRDDNGYCVSVPIFASWIDLQ